MKNLKVEKNVAVFEAFYPLNLSLFCVKRGFNCSIPFYKIHSYISVYLVIYKFIYMVLLQSVYIYGPGYDRRYLMVVLLGCPCKVPSLRIIS